MGACPEGYTWTRRPGGYQCNGGGHGVTDELLAERKGGIYGLRCKKWRDWEGKRVGEQGLYYPDSKGEYFQVG